MGDRSSGYRDAAKGRQSGTGDDRSGARARPESGDVSVSGDEDVVGDVVGRIHRSLGNQSAQEHFEGGTGGRPSRGRDSGEFTAVPAGTLQRQTDDDVRNRLTGLQQRSEQIRNNRRTAQGEFTDQARQDLARIDRQQIEAYARLYRNTELGRVLNDVLQYWGRVQTFTTSGMDNTRGGWTEDLYANNGTFSGYALGYPMNVDWGILVPRVDSLSTLVHELTHVAAFENYGRSSTHYLPDNQRNPVRNATYSIEQKSGGNYDTVDNKLERIQDFSDEDHNAVLATNLYNLARKAQKMNVKSPQDRKIKEEITDRIQYALVKKGQNQTRDAAGNLYRFDTLPFEYDTVVNQLVTYYELRGGRKTQTKRFLDKLAKEVRKRRRSGRPRIVGKDRGLTGNNYRQQAFQESTNIT